MLIKIRMIILHFLKIKKSPKNIQNHQKLNN